MAVETEEQTEFWAVYGGQGGRRIAQNLPSREAAEKVRHDFNYRLRDYPMPPTTIKRQHGRYSAALR